MRVIAGEFRSRKLLSMPGDDVRPTPDRLREALFNILSPVIEDCVFVDAYAGTGSVGIEALSRGARHASHRRRRRRVREASPKRPWRRGPCDGASRSSSGRAVGPRTHLSASQGR